MQIQSVNGPHGWVLLGQGPTYLRFKNPWTGERFSNVQQTAAFMDMHFPMLVVLTVFHARCDVVLYPEDDPRGPPSLQPERKTRFKLPAMPFERFCRAYQAGEIVPQGFVHAVGEKSVSATFVGKGDRRYELKSDYYRDPVTRRLWLTAADLERQAEIGAALRTNADSENALQSWGVYADHKIMPLQAKSRGNKSSIRFTDWLIRVGLDRLLAGYASNQTLVYSGKEDQPPKFVYPERKRPQKQPQKPKKQQGQEEKKKPEAKFVIVARTQDPPTTMWLAYTQHKSLLHWPPKPKTVSKIPDVRSLQLRVEPSARWPVLITLTDKEYTIHAAWMTLPNLLPHVLTMYVKAGALDWTSPGLWEFVVRVFRESQAHHIFLLNDNLSANILNALHQQLSIVRDRALTLWVTTDFAPPGPTSKITWKRAPSDAHAGMHLHFSLAAQGKRVIVALLVTSAQMLDGVEHWVRSRAHSITASLQPIQQEAAQ